MDNFFKQFKDNLDNLPEPAFQEEDWQALTHHLPPQREKRPIAIWLLWLLVPLFLMSLAANGFQYKAWENAQKKIDLHENRSETAKTVVIQSDTIYKTHTVYEHDTVYKTKILREKEIVYMPSLNDTFNTSKPFIETLNPIKKQLVAQNDTPKKARDKTDNFKDEKLIFNDLAQINLIPLKNIDILNPNKRPIINVVPIVLTKKKTLKERFELLRPKGYSVGISAGLAYPISNILSKPSGYTAGVQGEMSFSPHISAWADFQYMHLTYHTDRMSEAIGIPVVTPPAKDFTFSLVQVNQPTLQYGLGLRYRFDAQKWGQPYFGLGYGAMTSLPYEVSYEFKNGNLGTVWEVSQIVKKQKTDWGFLLLDADFERQLSVHYRWQLGANYRLKLSNSAQTYRLWGIKTGILFDF